nr:hypothetical protein [Tanacetum cinerariifolium]
PLEEPNLSASTTIVEVPKELPKVSLVNSSLKKFKFHLASFDMVVKERTTTIAITEGTWGFEHTKASFRDDIIPFVKALNYHFNPRYAIKECSSCGTLYTRDCVCSIGTVEDKILVPKPPKNCARYKIIFRTPDSPDQFHCFHCKDVLRSEETCKRCTCAKCGNGLGKGLCYICGHNQNSLNDSSSISETSSQSPPNINPCCYECGDPLDGIFCKRCPCKSCGNDAHIGNNCPSKVPKQVEKRIEEEQAAKAQTWKLSDDDGDEESSNSLNDNISELPLFSAITPDEPVLSTEEPDISLSMGDEHL